MKIALNLPRIMIYTKAVGHVQHNAFCRMFYSDYSKWPLFSATQERRHRRHSDCMRCRLRAGSGVSILNDMIVAGGNPARKIRFCSGKRKQKGNSL